MTRVDPTLSRLKFNEAVSQLSAQRAVLDARGIFVIGSPEYPTIEILFVSRRALQVAVPGHAEWDDSPTPTIIRRALGMTGRRRSEVTGALLENFVRVSEDNYSLPIDALQDRSGRHYTQCGR